MNQYNTEQIRQQQLDRMLPDDMKQGEGKRLLYVGGHLRYGRNLQMTDYFRKCGYTIDVIEVFPENVKQLTQIKWIGRLIEGDVRLFEPYFTYDAVVFWHGPEHLTKEETSALLGKMKRYAKAVIFATPNGRYDQGAEYGNEHENHISSWYAEDFEAMGMTVTAIGEPDRQNGNIIALWTGHE